MTSSLGCFQCDEASGIGNYSHLSKRGLICEEVLFFLPHHSHSSVDAVGLYSQVLKMNAYILSLIFMGHIWAIKAMHLMNSIFHFSPLARQVSFSSPPSL